MDKEQMIQEFESKRLIDELSKMPPMVIATAYLYAINFTLYGEDVTEKWATATQNAYALEKAHRKGYYEALQIIMAENEIRDRNDVLNKIIAEVETDLSFFCFDDYGNETTEWKEVKYIINGYKIKSEE